MSKEFENDNINESVPVENNSECCCHEEHEHDEHHHEEHEECCCHKEHEHDEHHHEEHEECCCHEDHEHDEHHKHKHKKSKHHDDCCHDHDHDDDDCCHEHKHEDECGCGCGHEHKHESGCGCDHDDGCGCGHDDGCGCGCGHDHGAVSVKKTVIRLVVSLLFLIPAIILSDKIFIIAIIFFIISYVIIAYDIVFEAVENLFHGHLLDENFLMAVASIGAFAIGEYFEAVIVIMLFQLGEMLQGLAVNKSRSNIKSLLNLRPDYANLKTEDGVNKVDPETIKVGDIICIYPGEKVPLDGEIIKGSSSLNTANLTGESLPQEVREGDSILSGCVNGGGELEVKVTTEFSESTVSKILSLVENASSNKSASENFITKFAKIYTPIVVGLAFIICVIVPLIIHMPDKSFIQNYSFWIHKGLSFLVVSCPCALVISIPLSYFGGIGGASRSGILVKGSNYLEALSKAGTVIWDKTGTLTKGNFSVEKAVSVNDNFTGDDLVKLAAHLECHSPHPIAKSILDKYNGEIDETILSDIQVIDGKGISGKYADYSVLIGNEKIMEGLDCTLPNDEVGTYCYIAIDNKYAGFLLVNDTIKEDSKEALDTLKSLGVRENIMLTGDLEPVADKVSKELGIDKFFAKLLPQGKVEKVDEIIKNNTSGDTIIFVGDGMNDAPVLKRADVGVAMGAFGSDAAIEAADVVLMNDSPSSLAKAVKIARKTHRIATENIIFSIAVKVAIMILILLGFSNMYMAVFADVGVCLIAILNSTRTLRSK